MPPRIGFREDDVLMKEVEQFIPVTQIPYSDFLSGDWNDHLINFKDMPKNVIKADGALECCKIISSYL